MTLEAGLAHGLEALKIPLSVGAEQKLLAYVALIVKWNRVYNLTAVREPEQMLTHHVLDSVAVAPHLTGSTLLDVGSGAGLPGIPLAIVLPHTQVTLLDSNQKKSAFQRQAVIELALNNVEVANARVESWATPRTFDTVISRAFASIAEFVSAAGRLCAPGGVLAAMKGAYPKDELTNVPARFRVQRVVPLSVPGLDAERSLVLMQASYS